MEEKNNKKENFILIEKTISVLQDIENDLKSIYGEMLTANTHYETLEDKLSDIVTNTGHILM